MAAPALFQGLDSSMLLDNLALPAFNGSPYQTSWNPMMNNAVWDTIPQQLSQTMYSLEESALDEILSSGDLQTIMEEEGSPSNWIVPPIGCNEKLVFNQICNDILLTPAPKQCAFEEVPHWIIEEALAQKKAILLYLL